MTHLSVAQQSGAQLSKAKRSIAMAVHNEGANTVTISASTSGRYLVSVSLDSAANYRMESVLREHRRPDGGRVKRGKGQRRNRRVRNGPALSWRLVVFLPGRLAGEP